MNSPSAQETLAEALRSELPHNLEAEQALLGAVLYDNAAFHLIPEDLTPEAFYEPFHGRLWESIAEYLRAGQVAEPIVLMEEFRRDPAFEELGGLRYLADLVDRAPPTNYAATYAAQMLELANKRTILAVAADMARMVVMGDGEERRVQDIVEAADRGLRSIQTAKPRERPVSIAEAADGLMRYLEDPTVGAGGIRTGIPALDVKLGPMSAGDLILLAGRPSMGKSALALAITQNVAGPALAAMLNGYQTVGLPPAVGALEIHGEMGFGDRLQGGQVVRRHVADIGYHLFGSRFPTYRDLKERKVSGEQLAWVREALEYLRNLPLFGVKRTGLTIAALRAIALRQRNAFEKQGYPLGLISVDHVGLMKARRPRDRYSDQTEIAIELKELADELGVPIIALVQLSRQIEQRDDKRPQLSDLRDTGAWEENADVVMTAYRAAYYARRMAEPPGNGGGSAQQQLVWAEWDRDCKSKTIEVGLPKMREGDTAAAHLWGEIAHNAIRTCEPEIFGRMLV